MEAVQNSSQTSDQSQPIDDVTKMIIGGCSVNGGDMVKKKRGRPPRVQAKSSPPVKMYKEEDEDVCFICFDGGSLVLCDRRGCPKAYHPACVKRDEAFFQSKAKWTCGWHICSICQKAAYYMCYTCTYSLCRGCIKKTDYVCVRGDKGFCTVCMKTIMLIENGGQGKDERDRVDFDDKTSWEYLFKVYWVYLKGKLSLTLDELTQAKNPSKGASITALDDLPQTKRPLKGASITPSANPSTCVHNGDNDLKSIKTDTPPQVMEASDSKRRKKDELMVIPHKESVSSKKIGTEERPSVVGRKDWATKELLDFVAHMRNGDTSVLSQFDVQELMLEYIKRNNLRDPKKKSQIICDSRLKILFGKPRVGHFEMLKLLEFHFFIQEDLPKNKINSITKQVDPDWNSDNIVTIGNKKRKNHRKVEERTLQNNVDEYAAIDVHNINLVYLRRKVMESFIGDSEEFNKKVIGSIVRIRLTGNGQKLDMYRLVRVVGTSKADAPYKIGNKSVNVMLEVLNLDKKETVSVDTISNQDLSEDECRRLRQSIRCGLVKRFTVGEIQEKAVSLQSVRLNDLLEAETLRLNNLRDRASEKGHKKSLREYVEKLQLLKTPEERERRLREIPEVHSDPKMNPDYETDDTEEYFNKEQETMKPKQSGVSRKITSSPKVRAEFSKSGDSRSWKNEQNKHLTIKSEEEKINTRKEVHGSNSSGRPQNQVIDSNGSTITNWNHRTTAVSSLPNSTSETATTTSSYSMRNSPISKDSETDKVWHYRDPSGKVQGPFCMVQLQKWSTTGYFPTDMKIWTNREDISLLLNDVLKEQLNSKTATEKVGNRIEGLTVRTTNLLSDNHGSSGQSSVQNWATNGQNSNRYHNHNHNPVSFAKSNESTRQFKMSEMASPTPVEDRDYIKPVSSVYEIGKEALVDLLSPTPKKLAPEDEKLENAGGKEQSLPSSETSVRDAGNPDGGAQLPKPSSEILVREAGNPASWNNDSSQDVGKNQLSLPSLPSSETSVRDAGNPDGGAQLPKPSSEILVREAGNPARWNNDSSQDVGKNQLSNTTDEWSGYSPTQVKQEERCPRSSQDIDGAQLPKLSSETLVREAGNPASWNNGSSQDVGRTQLPKTADEWSGYSPTQVKQEEQRLDGYHVAATAANTEQVISSSSLPSSQPGYNNYLPSWQGVRETIEFSTLAEESVSDLLAEVDAMESQNGFPSPTSRRNDFAEDLFTGSFEDFSPTPVHSASNGFSSTGIDIQLPFKWPEIAVASHSSEVQPLPQNTIDVNNSIKSDEGERQAKTSHVQTEEKLSQMRPDHNASETSHDRPGSLYEQKENECFQPTFTKLKDPSPEKVRIDYKDVTVQSAKVDGPPPPSLSLTIGLDQVYPRQGPMYNFGQSPIEFTARVNPHVNSSRGMTVGWDPHQRYNDNSLREKGYKVDDSGYIRNGKPWVRQSSFGSGSGVNGGAVGYPRPQPKGQRVCKFYESGRCKKGASCNYWHP